MNKIKDHGNGNYSFMCPGCDGPHSVSTIPEFVRQMSNGSRPCWFFNGDMEYPTFSPSVNYPSWCHFFVENGNIRFLDDCHHELKGKTVPLPEWSDE